MSCPQDAGRLPKGTRYGIVALFMILPRCLVLACCLALAGKLSAQSPPGPDPFGDDERSAKLAQRYEAMLVANPSEGVALDRLWKSYEERDATAALIDRYRLEAARSNTSPAWLVYGHLLKKAVRFEDADDAYTRAATINPQDYLPTLARGELALLMQRTDKAAPFFAAALEKLPPTDPRRVELLQKLGGAWLAAGDQDKAAETWERMIALSPANLALRKQLAETYVRNHLPEKALPHYEYIEQHADPATRALALRELGRLHESRGEFDAARDAFERGLALTSRDNWLTGELQGMVIRLYERAGRAHELEARWKQAADKTPRDLGGYLRLEALAEAQGDASARLAWLEKITTLAPRDRDSHLKLARLLTDAGQRERAAAVYDGMLKDQPDNVDLIFARADLDVQLDAPAAAIHRVEALLAKNPADETLAAPSLEFFLSHHLDEPAERCLRSAALRQPTSIEPAVTWARFCFSHRRPEDARRILETVATQPGDAPVRAERWQRIAALYKDENLSDDALRSWQEAAKLSPADPRPLLAASELESARGQNEAAAHSLEKALGVTPDGQPREEIERKLFQILSAGYGEPAPRPRLPDYTLSLGISAPVSVLRRSGPDGPSAPLSHHLDLLAESAARQPTPGNYLRLARWQWWAHTLGEAAVSAEKAIFLEPANIPARLLLVSVDLDTHQADNAERLLREVMEIDPARRAACLRQIAGLQSDAGNFEGALAGYADLAQAAPGAVEPLTDLALAQQRADRWIDAAATWKRAASLPSLAPAQRADVRRGLVAAYDHLGEYQPAAELLQKAVDEQGDLSRKQELFQELSEFCGIHELGNWLADRYEKRLNTQPDDYITLVAVAGIRKAQGMEHEAYQLLRRAYYSAPDPVVALKALADEAENLGEDDQAVTDRRRLIGMAGQNTAENLEKMAQLEENNLHENQAAQTWEQIVTRFPRDTAALARGAEFFERIGQPGRARELMSSAVAIESGNLSGLFHLGTLDLEAGYADLARANFERVLTQSQPERPGDALRFPADFDVAADATAILGGGTLYYRSRLAGASPARAASSGGDEPLRLQAIYELARLLPDRSEPGAVGARKVWLSRWSLAAAAGARSEPLAAFLASGENALAMDLFAGWQAAQPASEEMRAMFLIAGLRLGEYGRLARWAWLDGNASQKAQRGPQLVNAMEQFLATGGKPGEGMVGALFPPEVRARDLLWKAAKEGFAERRWYAQAAELGEKVVAQAASGWAAYAVEVGQWELYLGKADRARQLLRDAVNEGGGTTLDATGGSPVFEALRAYYLLLPPEERADFVESYLRQWRERGDPVHGVLSSILLHGLAGDMEAAHGDLDAFLAMRMVGQDLGGESADARRWGCLLSNGTQLQNWNLGSLTIYLWRKALQEGSAFELQNADVQTTRNEIRNRLAALEITLAANPEIAREKLTEYLAGNPPVGLVTSLAAQMVTSSQYRAARQIYESLTESEPDDGESWRGLLNACETIGDTDAVERILLSLLNPARRLPSALNRVDLVCRLASHLEIEGNAPGARQLLEALLHGSTVAPMPVAQLAQSYELAGRNDEAARVWQIGITGDPGNAHSYRLSLAALEEGRGNFVGAIPFLEAEVAVKNPNNGVELKTRLARAYLKAGRVEDARTLALGFSHANELDSLAAIAQAFGEARKEAMAREWLAAGIRRTRDPQKRFQLQRQLLQQSLRSDDLPLADFLREMRRLKQFADVSPSLKSVYEFARYDLARQRGADEWLESQLRQEWRVGKGDFEAGGRLAEFYMDHGQEGSLRQVIEAIDHRPNLPEQALYTLERRLLETGHPALALSISERLYQRFPQNEVYVLGRARVLWKTGRTDEANRLLESLDQAAVFREDTSPQIAALYEELGDTERSRMALKRAVQRDPACVRAAPAYLRLAQIEIGRRNWPEAGNLLRAVCRNSPGGDLPVLADYLRASGRCDGDLSRRLPGDDFPLSFTRRAQLAAAVYANLKAANRLDDARQLVFGHPVLLAGSAILATEFRQDADPANFAAEAAAFEQAAAQATLPVARLDRELAAVYLKWSDQELNDGRDSTSRRDHLDKANQLEPGNFEVARRLAALCWETGQPAQAVAVLQPFLAADAVPVEREQARLLLSDH